LGIKSPLAVSFLFRKRRLTTVQGFGAQRERSQAIDSDS